MKSRPSLKDWDKNFMELKSDLESLRECLKNLFLALPDCQIWQVLEPISVFKAWIWQSKSAINELQILSGFYINLLQQKYT